jgi:hypothetical protein
MATIDPKLNVSIPLTGPVNAESTGDTPAIQGTSYVSLPTAANPAGTLGSAAGVIGSSGTGPGVMGSSVSGYAGQFDGKVMVTGNLAVTDTGVAIQGQSNSELGVGVLGVLHGTPKAFAYVGGVFGATDLPEAAGVYGYASGGIGVNGVADSGTGVQAISQSGLGLKATSSGNNAIQAVGTAQGFDTILAQSSSPQHAAVSAQNSNNGFGLWASCTNGMAIFGQSNNVAAQFNGNVNIYGTLTHNGNATVTGILTVNQDVVLAGADCAEEFDIATDNDVEPGAVMVLGEAGSLRQCNRAYDRMVAGVISGAGAYRPGLVLDRNNSSGKRLPLALVGKVYCKVDAQYGPIGVGDLLTTSPTKGHAMRAEDPLTAFGAVIGKALGSLESGRGLIPMLIALQ